jgi:hypothetical protein
MFSYTSICSEQEVNKPASLGTFHSWAAKTREVAPHEAPMEKMPLMVAVREQHTSTFLTAPAAGRAEGRNLICRAPFVSSHMHAWDENSKCEKKVFLVSTLLRSTIY